MTKVMPSLVYPINWRPLTLDGVNLEDVQSFVYLGSSIMPSEQGAAEVERWKGAERSAFVHLKQSLWGRREISTATKGHIYQAIAWTILLYGCETWPLRAIDLRKLEVFDNDCLRNILRCHRIDHVSTTTLRHRLNLRSLPPILLQHRLWWFGHAARCPEGELIHDVLLPTSFLNWQKHISGKLKTWASTIKDDLAVLSGPQVAGLWRWNRDWLAISCDLAQDRRMWVAIVWDAVLAREEADSTWPGWKPIQVQVVRLKTYIREAFVKKEHLTAIFYGLDKVYNTNWKYDIKRDLHDLGLKGRIPDFICNFFNDTHFQIKMGD